MSPVRSQKVHTSAFLHTLAGRSPCGLWDRCTGRPLLEAAPSKQDADSSLLCAGGVPSEALQGPLASLLLSLQASNQYIFFLMRAKVRAQVTLATQLLSSMVSSVLLML